MQGYIEKYGHSVIGVLRAEGIKKLEDVDKCLDRCVCPELLQAVAKAMIEAGQLTENDLNQ